MEYLSICGLDCAVCPAYTAHITDDWGLRKATAKEWSKAFGFECKPEMIDCVGCTTVDGVHIGHCFECVIRKCGLGRGVANCGLCEMFEGCAIIGDFLVKVPYAKANLERARASAKPKLAVKPKAKPKPKMKPKAQVKPKAKAKPKAQPKAKTAKTAKRPGTKARRSR
jgi:hypothetical protein